MEPKYQIITVDETNFANHPQAICFINPKHPSYKLKVEWLSARFKEGLRIKLVYAEGEKRPVGFLEYVPGEKCWRAVSAAGYLFIHCIWVNAVKHKNLGVGSMLLEECLRDAAANGYYGVAAMTSNGAFMANKSLFERNGFIVADKTPPHHELMVKRIKQAPLPVFNDWPAELAKYQGFHIIYSRQCPWVARFVNETVSSAREMGIKPEITEISTSAAAQSAPSPYAVFTLINKGKILADHYISGTRFMNILKKEKLIP